MRETKQKPPDHFVSDGFLLNGLIIVGAILWKSCNDFLKDLLCLGFINSAAKTKGFGAIIKS